jgi:hypothetical protein
MLTILICFSYLKNKEYHINSRHIYHDISTVLSYCQRLSNVVVITDLPMKREIQKVKWIIVTSLESFKNSLKTIINSKPPLFLYFSGHGVVEDGEFNIVIPGEDLHSYYPGAKLVTRLSKFMKKDSVIIFDCCHGELFLSLPYISETPYGYIPKLFFIFSCQSDEKCGFDKVGSSFTNKLFKILSEGSNILTSQIMVKVGSFAISSDSIKLPKWLISK